MQCQKERICHFIQTQYVLEMPHKSLIPRKMINAYLSFLLAVSFGLVFLDTFESLYADSKPYPYVAQDMLRISDVYVDSDVQTQAPWKIETISGKHMSFYCDKTEQSVFDMGKTTVRCIASDTEGNESRTSFVVTIGYTVVQIPDWFEQPTKFWLNGMISDKEYVASLKSLLMQNVIQIPTAEFEGNPSQNIPVWIKQNAQKWVEHKITDDEFSIGLQWMTKNF